jgi:hypothetical protein
MSSGQNNSKTVPPTPRRRGWNGRTILLVLGLPAILVVREVVKPVTQRQGRNEQAQTAVAIVTADPGNGIVNGRLLSEYSREFRMESAPCVYGDPHKVTDVGRSRERLQRVVSPDGDTVLVRTVHWVTGSGTRVLDSAVYDRATLTLRWSRSRAGQLTQGYAVRGREFEWSATNPDATVDSRRIVLPHAAFVEEELDLLLQSLTISYHRGVLFEFPVVRLIQSIDTTYFAYQRDTVRVLGRERVTVAGRTADAWVVSTTVSSHTRFWIDARTRTLLKTEAAGSEGLCAFRYSR